MSARDDILSAIRARRRTAAPTPPEYHAPVASDLAQSFSEQARRANAEVQFVNSNTDVPHAVAELLRARNLPAMVHVPPSASHLPSDLVPGLTCKTSAPRSEDTAIAIAPFGIAETGTIAYCSGADAPASWHFRAGFEIAVLHARSIVPSMEDVFYALKSAGTLPSTINFVTGPSRTGDIEQTLELGAHGPKALAILIVRC